MRPLCQRLILPPISGSEAATPLRTRGRSCRAGAADRPYFFRGVFLQFRGFSALQFWVEAILNKSTSHFGYSLVSPFVPF